MFAIDATRFRGIPLGMCRYDHWIGSACQSAIGQLLFKILDIIFGGFFSIHSAEIRGDFPAATSQLCLTQNRHNIVKLKASAQQHAVPTFVNRTMSAVWRFNESEDQHRPAAKYKVYKFRGGSRKKTTFNNMTHFIQHFKKHEAEYKECSTTG